MPNKIEDNNTSLYEILRTIQELPEGDSAVITAAVEETDSGAVISVTDANGTTTATLSNGKDGVTPEKVSIILPVQTSRNLSMLLLHRLLLKAGRLFLKMALRLLRKCL